jgi:hypothetical protein
MTNVLTELERLLSELPEEKVQSIAKATEPIFGGLKWIANPGPQILAYESEADELFYGGGAGGGKTDLLLGTALNQHRRSLILRRLNAEVEGLIDRMVEIVGNEKGLKRNPPARWVRPNQIIMFGGCQHLDDRKKYQGVPKDLIGFDEVSNFLREQYEFIIAWARSTMPGQRVRVIATGNPPTNAEGMWVLERWGAWLDPNHPNPALPGELRWYTTIGGKDTEVDGPGPVVIDDIPMLDERGKPIMPKSRTFIPAQLDDNPDLAETGYGATLSALPEELRRAMAQGDFSASQQDDEYQVFPGEWIDAAMQRWFETGGQKPMDVLAVDVAQGGKDRTVFVARHGSWYARPIVYPGSETPDGPSVAGLVFRFLKNGAEVIIDMGGGYGGSVNDHLKQTLRPTLYSGAETAEAMRDRSGVFKFINMRAAACWSLREALDPAYGSYIALPPDQELKAELASYRWKVVPGSKIQVLPKEEIRQILGRSPDKADAVIMAHSAKGKTDGFRNGIGSSQPTRALTSGRNPNRRGRP